MKNKSLIIFHSIFYLMHMFHLTINQPNLTHFHI